MLKSRILLTLGSLILLTPAGFGCKFYRGPAAAWFNNSLGGALYEIFWCLVLFLWLPRARFGAVAAGVFAATCLLEFAQLWRHPFLEAFRGYFIGRVLIGTTFQPSDFFYYALGSLLGWLWLRWIQDKTTSAPAAGD